MLGPAIFTLDMNADADDEDGADMEAWPRLLPTNDTSSLSVSGFVFFTFTLFVLDFLRTSGTFNWEYMS